MTVWESQASATAERKEDRCVQAFSSYRRQWKEKDRFRFVDYSRNVTLGTTETIARYAESVCRAECE